MPLPARRQRDEAVRILNGLGWPDTAIAGALNVSAQTVCKTRKINNIGPVIRHNRIDDKAAIELHSKGLNDQEISRELDVDPSAVCKWRTKHSLPAHNVKPSLSDAQKRLARRMLREGASRASVAKAVGCCKETIQSIRDAMPSKGLRKTGQTDRNITASIRDDSDIWPRIEKAIGRINPSHIREDAVHEMYADVLEGRLSADLIEAKASRYRSRAYNMCGFRFGYVSLNAENDNGLTLAETIADPNETRWLE